MSTLASSTDALPIPTRHVGRQKNWLVRLIRWVVWRLLFFWVPRKETATEKINRLAAKRRTPSKDENKNLKVEAVQYAAIIPEKLADLNICFRYRRRANERERVKKIRFQTVKWAPEVIYLKVDFRPGKSPRGVGLAQLQDPETLRALGVACARRVSTAYSANTGFWYVVEREQGVRGIPKHVQWQEMLDSRPPQADRLALPLGVTDGRRVVWKSLGSMYSMLIAGTIGGGKSNILNVLICALIGYNSPTRLKLALVDLKGGVEFSFYSVLDQYLLDIPKPKPPEKKKKLVKVAELDEDGNAVESETEVVADELTVADFDETGERVPALIEKREHVPHLLAWIIREGERRLDKLKEKKCKSIGQYNWSYAKWAMPHIVLIIDEWADVKLDRRLGRQAEELLINIASRFRAAGIHVILCTQVPNKDVVSIRIKNVLPAKLAFSCPDIHASMLIVGDGSAHGLEPAGRCIYDWGGARMEIQTPFIPNNIVDERVKEAAAGRLIEIDAKAQPQTDVSSEEMFQWCITHRAGLCERDVIFGQFRERKLTQHRIDKILQDYTDEIVHLEGNAYKLLAPSAHSPRRLQAFDQFEEFVAPESMPAAPPAPPPSGPPPVAPPPTPAPLHVNGKVGPMLLWAFDHNDGKLNVKALIDNCNLAETFVKKALRDVEGKDVVIDGRVFRVTAIPINAQGKTNNKIGRKIMALGKDGITPDSGPKPPDANPMPSRSPLEAAGDTSSPDAPQRHTHTAPEEPLEADSTEPEPVPEPSGWDSSL